MNTRHILFAIDSLVGRGAEKVVATLSAAFVESGHVVSLVIYEDVIEYPIDPRVRLYRLNPAPRQGLRMLENRIHRANARKFMEVVKRAEAAQGHVDLIVSNLPRMDKVLSFLNDERVFFVIHNTLSIQNGFHKKPWYRHVSRILQTKRVYDGKQVVSVSDGVGEDLIEAMRVHPKSIRTIYNPVDFQEVSLRADEVLDPPAEDFILHVGAYTIRQKRQDLIIKAFAKSGLSCKLVFVGKGRDEEEIRRIAHAEQVGDQVIVAGFRANPYPWMKAAKFLVVGSDYEGLGMVLVEALSVGTPAISTDCKSGPSEILTGEMRRGLVAVNDVDSMAEKMRLFYETPPDVDLSTLNRFSTQSAMTAYLSLIPA